MTWMHAMTEVARKEVLQHTRTARLIVVGILFVIALVLTTIVFPLVIEGVFGGDLGILFAEGTGQNQIFAFFLGVGSFFPFIGGLFYIQLMAIILTADGVTSEWQRRTVFLLLSRPVPRSAFVVGKFVGAWVVLLVPMLVLCLLDYLVLIGLYEGTPSAEAWMRFFAGLGILSAGAGAYGAMALFFSSLMKSNVASFITALGMWIVVFPLLTLPGTIMYSVDQAEAFGTADEGPDASDWKYEFWNLMSPGSLMRSAAVVMTDFDDGASWELQGPTRTWLAPLGLIAYTGVFLAGSLAVVHRRNFE